MHSEGPGQISSRPGTQMPKQTFKLNGAAYRGLGLSGFDVGDTIKLVVTGKVTQKGENPFEKEAIDIAFEASTIEDHSPRKGVDENNRIL
tara:strand:- start:123 stop:392 length:270 start_codon:yes stop_codon:yes gene_type:complete